MGQGATEACWVDWRLLRWQRQPLDITSGGSRQLLACDTKGWWASAAVGSSTSRLGQSLAAVLCCSIVLQRHYGLHSQNCASLLAM